MCVAAAARLFDPLCVFWTAPIPSFFFSLRDEQITLWRWTFQGCCLGATEFNADLGGYSSDARVRASETGSTEIKTVLSFK